MEAFEVNFDGLVGPTHNYAGLSYGNVASLKHAHFVSNPKEAAIQGLEKMRLLMELGVHQAVLPPHERPNISILRRLGFYGTDIQVLEKAHKEAPNIFYACYSSSSMWSANAATVAPSCDTRDGRLHICIANLISYFHRAQESNTYYEIFKKIFLDDKKFQIHPALPSAEQLGDEGAANHNRFCENYGSKGLHLFIYGREGFNKKEKSFTRFPARQTKEASMAIARIQRLPEESVIFAMQNSLAIEAGVFHNDVISVANKRVFLYHEKAFQETEAVIDTIQQKSPIALQLIKISDKEIGLSEAVRSYLFNSQIVSRKTGEMAIIVPEECRENKEASNVLARILAEDNPIRDLYYVNCQQSMQNGGGPACLRLRVVMNQAEIKACNPRIFLNEALYQELKNWVNRHYRDSVCGSDLLDPDFIAENRAALEELTRILNLGSLYSFQGE